MPVERVDGVQPHIAAMLDKGPARRRIADRRFGEGEVLRPVVVQDEEAILPADHGVVDRILHVLATRPHGGERRLRVGRVAEAQFRCHRAAGGDDDVLIAACTSNSDPEPFVGFIIDALGRQPGTHSMAPYGVRAPRIIHGDVVDGAVVRRPGGTRADPDDLVVEALSGA